MRRRLALTAGLSLVAALAFQARAAAPAGAGGAYQVRAFGGARAFGAPGGALNAPLVGIAATPRGNGYWLLAADGGVFPVNTWRTISRTEWPAGTSGTPTRASRSAKSGGAHTRTSAPSARSAPASPTIGSTSPRDPYVDNNTRTCRPPFRRFWVQPACPSQSAGIALTASLM